MFCKNTYILKVLHIFISTFNEFVKTKEVLFNESH